MKDIKILTYHDLSAAYSCLIYLKSNLEKNYNVSILSFTPIEKITDKNHYSFYNKWFGYIRVFRIYFSRIYVFFLMMFSKTNIFIINDLDFFIAGYYTKKIKKNKIKIIHYNTEIHGTDVHYPNYIVKFYEKHADYPDLIVDCLKERSEYRKEKFKIKQKIYTINNTFPFSLSKKIKVDDTVKDKYLNFNNNLPILIYAGGCDLNRNLGDIIKCIPKFESNLNFVFFCYGTEFDFNSVKKMVDNYSKPSNAHIFKAIPREELFKVMEFCDIGFSYYEPSLSINHLYASPSKIYEYFACGLNVLTSNNIGINRIVNEYKLGYCIKQDDTIEDALNKILEQGLKSKTYIKNIFKDKLCYEKDSCEAIEAILNIFK